MEYYKYKYGSADLHNHTTASDGLLSPGQLIEYAGIKGLKAVAITDHDTTDGINEAAQKGEKVGIEVVPGIEINTQKDGVEIHILGYFISAENRYLQSILTDMRLSRVNRTRLMVEKLADLYDFDITYEEVLREAKEGTVARPHIARVLMAKGIVNSVTEAFNKYIGTDCPAYVDRYRMTPEQGIDLIKGAGGTAVLAHPGLLHDNNLVNSLLKLDFRGIEAFHSKHLQDETEYYARLAQKHNLIITGGSDCHGELIDGLPIIGDVSVGMNAVEDLRLQL